MSKDATTPATKADLTAFEERILKALSSMQTSLNEKMDVQFQFVAEKLTESLNRFDAIDERLDGIEDRLDVMENGLMT